MSSQNSHDTNTSAPSTTTSSFSYVPGKIPPACQRNKKVTNRTREEVLDRDGFGNIAEEDNGDGDGDDDSLTQPSTECSDREESLNRSQHRSSLLPSKQSQNMETKWIEQYNEMKNFKRNFDDLSVPAGDQYGLKILYQWMATQRFLYKTGKLSHEKVRLLEAEAFQWVHNRDKWHANFAKLKVYKHKFGNFDVSSSFDGALYKWIRQQRTEYDLFINKNPSSLTTDQLKLLSDANFQWNENALSHSYPRIADVMPIKRKFSSAKFGTDECEDVPPEIGNSTECRGVSVGHENGAAE